MMKNKARKYSSPLLTELLNEITPAEQEKTANKMQLAARLEELIAAKQFSKSAFAEKLNKNPSEVSKWLSGTHNFTIDTLTDIALALGMPVAELLAPKEVQVINKMFVIVSREVNPVPVEKYVTARPEGIVANMSSYQSGNMLYGTYPISACKE